MYDSNSLIMATIAILHPFFFTLLVDKYSGYNEIDEKCDKIPFSLDDKTKPLRDACNAKRDQVGLNKHLILIGIAFASIIISVAISSKVTKSGIGLGGLLLLVYTLVTYWRKYGDNMRLAIIGVSLLLTILISTKMNKLESVSDIFTINFYKN